MTDSTACLPPQLATTSSVAVVQLQLQVGDQLDEEARVSTEHIVDAMRSGRSVTTAPPDPGAFFWTYQDAAARGVDAVVSLHISARQSQTCEIARQAAAQVRVPVHVVDTATTGMSLGYAVLAAAEAADRGADAGRVIAAAEHRFASSTELIYVDTLEYLRRGGRIGAAAALVGTALSLKPLLTMDQGQVSPLDKAFGTDRALRKMVDTAVRRAGSGPVDLAVEHFGAPERATDLVQRLRSRVPQARELVLTEVSAIIGAHVGPGALGVTISPY